MTDKKIDTTFPFIKVENYMDPQEIADSFPHLINVNKNTIDFNNIKQARCFVIRSNTDDDVHKAIKYGVWTSTPKNQEKLNQVYLECEKQGINVFLFFSVVKSGQFEGIARLTSGVQQINFPYWWQQGKWKQLFKIEWIYVKDVAYKYLDGIFNIDDMIITRSRDGTEVTWEDNGKKMFKVFSEMDCNETIFKDFNELDEREQSLRDQKYTPYRYNSKAQQQQQGFSSDMNQMQYMQMMNMWMYQQMMWQQQQMYQQQQPQFMQQQQFYPQYQNYQAQQQQQQQQDVNEQQQQATNIAPMNPNLQNFSQPQQQQQQQPEQIEQYQNQ